MPYLPISRIKFREISTSTLQSVKNLLFQRNKTMPEYVDWKYGTNSPNGFRGIVAFDDDQEIGCFGCVPLKITDKSGNTFEVGWFADWFVVPSMRGSGLGTELLNKISTGYPIFFGHPGPKSALDICLKNGWEKISFQSSLRILLEPVSYFRYRTNILPKFVVSLFKHYLEIGKNKLKSINTVWPEKEYRFEPNVGWFTSQPVNPKFFRSYSVMTDGVSIFEYADDHLPSGAIRRRILRVQNIHENLSSIIWFITESRKSKINRLEFFTTDQTVSSILKHSGATQFYESPIVFHGSGFSYNELLIEGINRENWLFLANLA